MFLLFLLLCFGAGIYKYYPKIIYHSWDIFNKLKTKYNIAFKKDFEIIRISTKKNGVITDINKPFPINMYTEFCKKLDVYDFLYVFYKKNNVLYCKIFKDTENTEKVAKYFDSVIEYNKNNAISSILSASITKNNGEEEDITDFLQMYDGLFQMFKKNDTYCFLDLLKFNGNIENYSETDLLTIININGEIFNFTTSDILKC